MSKLSLGLDIGSHQVKLVALSAKGRGYRLDQVGMMPLPPETIVDEELLNSAALVSTLRELLAKTQVRRREASIALGGRATIIRHIRLPAMTEAELEESLAWEAKQYIPFDLEEVYLDFHMGAVDEETEGGDDTEVEPDDVPAGRDAPARAPADAGLEAARAWADEPARRDGDGPARRGDGPHGPGPGLRDPATRHAEGLRRDLEEVRSEAPVAPPRGPAPLAGRRASPAREERPRGPLPGERGAGTPEMLGGAGAELPPAPAWGLALADEMLAPGLAAKRRDEEPFWPVRERLASRLGRMPTMRAVRHAAHKAERPNEVMLPGSDEEVVVPMRRGSRENGRRWQPEDADDRGRDRDRDRDRDRKRRRRRSSSSSSSSSARPSRGAPSCAAGSRAQRDTQDQPHMAVVETLEEVTRSLPRACEGANMGLSDLYKVLRAVFTTWFTLKLEPQLRGQPGGMRGLRGCRALTEVVGDLLAGAALPSLMKILGRVRAITEVPSGWTWEVAQHHALVETDNVGLLTRRGRHTATLSQTESARLQRHMRGAGMRPAASEAACWRNWRQGRHADGRARGCQG